MDFYSIIDDLENLYAEIVIFENGSCACYYCFDGALLTYSSLDKIINNVPTNYMLIKDLIPSRRY